MNVVISRKKSVLLVNLLEKTKSEQKIGKFTVTVYKGWSGEKKIGSFNITQKPLELELRCKNNMFYSCNKITTT